MPLIQLAASALLPFALSACTSTDSKVSESQLDTPPTATDPTGKPTVAASPDIPDGYVDMGDGTWIPDGGPGDCDASAMISIKGQGNVPDTARLLRPENLADMGPREFAHGQVGYNDDGGIVTYTVAAGDSLGAIGDRFCIYNGLMLATLNGYKGYQLIQPGDLLVLDPAAMPGFKFVNPDAG